MTKSIIGTIITDCSDGSARTRQELRFNELFGVQPTFLGVGSYGPVEAAGTLIDQLDVLTHFPLVDKERTNIVLVNVAPRDSHVKRKWGNGTPFCYFRTGNTLVFSTFEDSCLSLARDFGIADEVELFDIPTVMAAAVEWGDLTAEAAAKITHTQFRSLEFLPLVAYWIWQGKPVPSRTQSLAELPSVKNRVWYVDNFDNVKTTLLPADVAFEEGKKVALSDDTEAVCYKQLADVPDGETALTIGSSGYGANRFLEVVIGGRGKAAGRHGFAIGQPVLQSQAQPAAPVAA